MLSIFILISIISSVLADLPETKVTAADRIRRHNYPVETHKVQTEDGYILTLFRIPFSPKNQNQNITRPAVLLMHGLMMSADVWILSGPISGLAFNLADQGFDVFMGNARGNRYGKKHVRIPISSPEFWNFSWTEIAIYDLKAMLLYVLDLTGQKGIHYISHMEGSTCIMVLLSEYPEFNQLVLTIQMMGPIAYMNNAKSPILKVMAPFLGKPSKLVERAGSSEFLFDDRLVRTLTAKACSEASPLLEFCANVLFFIVGYSPYNLNYTLLPEIWATTPAGGSGLEYFHYLQLYNSGEFRHYDHGPISNLKKYGQLTPPDFDLKKIVAPVRLIYCDNDLMCGVEDVHRLAEKLPNVDNLTRMTDKLFSHIDYIFSTDVKKTVNDGVIDYILKKIALN